MAENVLPTARLLPRIVYGVVVCVGGVAGLYALAVFFLLVPDRNYHNRNSAQTQVLLILGEIEAMALKEQSMPKSIEDVLTHAQRSGDSDVAKLSGLDPWGTPYCIEVVRDPSYSHLFYRLTVRSFGRNRRDDLGKGDDLQLRRPGWVPLSLQKTPPQDLGEPTVAP